MSNTQVLTVSELTRQIKNLVEANLSRVCVVGEISNCTRAASGHIYLTLKDDSAQLRGVMWRSRAARIKFDVQDGLEVVATGPIEVYEARGTYQLIIEQLIPQGVGALELAFRQLQEKLAAAGLFDPGHKRPLPRFPRRIALITSPTSAAVRDMLQVITRRWQAVDIVILPVAVQGDGAAQQIAAALQMVHQIPGVDVVIAGRGGGSLEDLWAFNEEVVARAIYDCRLPVISAVGHEIDVSIADLVADCRALTPSEAAELVVPSGDEFSQQLQRFQERLCIALTAQAPRARLQLDSLATRPIFSRPLERIHDLTARTDELADRARRAIASRLQTDRRRLSELAGGLRALSPLNVLSRGYSVTYRAQSDTILHDVAEVSTGEEIVTWLARGRINSRVESTDAESNRLSPPE